MSSNMGLVMQLHQGAEDMTLNSRPADQKVWIPTLPTAAVGKRQGAGQLVTPAGATLNWNGAAGQPATASFSSGSALDTSCLAHELSFSSTSPGSASGASSSPGITGHLGALLQASAHKATVHSQQSGGDTSRSRDWSAALLTAVESTTTPCVDDHGQDNEAEDDDVIVIDDSDDDEDNGEAKASKPKRGRRCKGSEAETMDLPSRLKAIGADLLTSGKFPAHRLFEIESKARGLVRTRWPHLAPSSTAGYAAHITRGYYAELLRAVPVLAQAATACKTALRDLRDRSKVEVALYQAIGVGHEDLPEPAQVDCQLHVDRMLAILTPAEASSGAGAGAGSSSSSTYPQTARDGLFDWLGGVRPGEAEDEEDGSGSEDNDEDGSAEPQPKKARPARATGLKLLHDNHAFDRSVKQALEAGRSGRATRGKKQWDRFFAYDLPGDHDDDEAEGAGEGAVAMSVFAGAGGAGRPGGSAPKAKGQATHARAHDEYGHGPEDEDDDDDDGSVARPYVFGYRPDDGRPSWLRNCAQWTAWYSAQGPAFGTATHSHQKALVQQQIIHVRDHLGARKVCPVKGCGELIACTGRVGPGQALLVAHLITEHEMEADQARATARNLQPVYLIRHPLTGQPTPGFERRAGKVGAGAGAGAGTKRGREGQPVHNTAQAISLDYEEGDEAILGPGASLSSSSPSSSSQSSSLAVLALLPGVVRLSMRLASLPSTAFADIQPTQAAGPAAGHVSAGAGAGASSSVPLPPWSSSTSLPRGRVLVDTTDQMDSLALSFTDSDAAGATGELVTLVVATHSFGTHDTDTVPPLAPPPFQPSYGMSQPNIYTTKAFISWTLGGWP